MICPNCGSEIKDDVKFCPNCGYKNEVQSDKNNMANDNKFVIKPVMLIVIILMIILGLFLLFRGGMSTGTMGGKLKIVTDENGRQYFDEDGEYFYDTWVEYKKHWYYSDLAGYIAKDQVVQGVYYVDKDGKMLADEFRQNPITLEWYYYDQDGKMVVRQIIEHKGSKYAIDEFGVMIYNRFFHDFVDPTKIRFANEKGEVIYGKCFILYNGDTFFIDENGYIIFSSWIEFDGSYYYLLSNGILARNMWIERTYYVDHNGKMLYSTTTPDGYQVDASGKIIGKLKSEKSKKYTLKFISSDVSEFPNVKLFYKVYDNNGNVVSNFNPSEINVVEKNAAGVYIPRIVNVSEIISQKYGLNTSIVADRSTSLNNNDLQKAKNAMRTFVNNMDFVAGDKSEIISFGDDIVNTCNYTNDLSSLYNGIDSISLSGSTALYDAIYRGISHASNQNGARCVIAFTDGYDNRSSNTKDSIVQYSLKQQVPVYIVGVGSSVNTAELESLAKQTNGKYWNINNIGEIGKVYKNVYTDEKSTYYIQYVTDPDGSRKYSLRDVVVNLDNGTEYIELHTDFYPPTKTNDNTYGGSQGTPVNGNNNSNNTIDANDNLNSNDSGTTAKLGKGTVIKQEYDFDDEKTVNIRIIPPVLNSGTTKRKEIANRNIGYAMDELMRELEEIVDNSSTAPKTITVGTNTMQSINTSELVIKMDGTVTYRGGSSTLPLTYILTIDFVNDTYTLIRN